MIPEYTSCQEGCSGIPFFTVLMTVYRVNQRQTTRSLYCHLKLASTGYIVNTDTTPLKKQYEEMHKIGVNINQIAKKVNTTGDLYPEEMKELKEMVKELWHILRSSQSK